MGLRSALKHLFTRVADDTASPAPDTTDIPGVVGFGYKTAWFAVRGTETGQVIDALGLEDVKHKGWAQGLEAVGEGSVFVTPPVDGWVLIVVGLELCPDTQDKIDRIEELLLDLSSRFGTTQYFASYRVVDFVAWARAQDGKLLSAVSFCSELDGFVWLAGAMSADERALGLIYEGHDLAEWSEAYFDALEHGDDDARGLDEEVVIQLAGAWSIDPTTLESRTDVNATGWLARWPAS